MVCKVYCASNHEKTAMNINAIYKQIAVQGDIAEIRKNICNLLEEQLHLCKDKLGYWEKESFSNAIAALGWNVNARNQPPGYWLRLCLVNIEYALVPVSQRHENYTPNAKQYEELSFEQLIEAIDSLRQHGS